MWGSDVIFYKPANHAAVWEMAPCSHRPEL